MPVARLPDEDVPFVLTERRWCTPVVAALTLAATDRPIEFAAGQYVLVQDAARTVPVRSYSLANAPRPSGALSLLVTAVPGGPTSTWLTWHAEVGDGLLVSGPFGTFTARAGDAVSTLYLAGGSGLAPVKSLLEDAAADPLIRAARHTLVFSGRTAADLIDRAELQALAGEWPGFDYHYTLTRPDGDRPVRSAHVPAVLPGLLSDLSAHDVYISGSPGFVDACRSSAEQLGARAGHVHTEEFYTDPVPWTDAPTPHPATGGDRR